MITRPNRITKLDSIPENMTAALREWRNSPEIFKWCRQNDLLTEWQHKKWMAEHPQNKTIRMYLIRDTHHDEAVGVCGLTDLDLINQRAEFSIYIAPQFKGHGYGKDALQLLCQHGFDAYPLKVIWGECFFDNPAIKTFEEVGFKKDGIRRDFYFRDGKHIDAVLISIRKEELAA